MCCDSTYRFMARQASPGILEQESNSSGCQCDCKLVRRLSEPELRHTVAPQYRDKPSLKLVQRAS